MDIELAREWAPRLRELVTRIRTAARGAMRDALARDRLDEVMTRVGEGAGDTTYALDLRGEDAVHEWLLDVARERPLSLMTEDVGWRHVGPAPGSSSGDEPVELPGFDHGGPRIALDPVDGTRNLMTDLRAAWTVVSFAGPGEAIPRFPEVVYGIVAEIPDSRAAHYRTLEAFRGAGCTASIRNLADDLVISDGALFADADDRVDHGYFPFFAYHPDLRPDIARLAAGFFARVAEGEGADVRNCYDDQYISSGGQLALLALGVYRMIVEARGHIAERRGRATQTCKPYDMAGAALCASEAGCVVTGIDGGGLDFPIDTETPVNFVGFANGATGARLWPHLAEAFDGFRPA